jgi:hypothetical protein
MSYGHFVGVLQVVTLLIRDLGRAVLTCLHCRISPQHPFSGNDSGYDGRVR